MKQVIRAANCNHDISKIQQVEFHNGDMLIKYNHNNAFTRTGINAFNDLGHKVFNELVISHDPETAIHKEHIIRLTLMNIWQVNKLCVANRPLMQNLLSLEAKKSNLQGLCDIPESPTQIAEVVRKTLPGWLTNRIRDMDDPNISCTNKIAIRVNIFRSTEKLKHREIYLHEEAIKDPLLESNRFLGARKILVLRERMTQYMDILGKTYTNVKLNRLKIRDNPFCKRCDNVIEPTYSINVTEPKLSGKHSLKSQELKFTRLKLTKALLTRS